MPKSKYKKRIDGRYCYQIRTGEYHPDSGKEIIKTLYGNTIAELDGKVREIRRQQETGLFIDDKGLTVEEWSKQWLAAYKTQGEDSTQTMYKGAVKNHILPPIGKMKIKDIRNQHLQAVLSGMATKYSERMVKIVKMTMQQMFHQAHKNQLIAYDHSEDLKAFGKEPVERDALNEKERAAMLSAANEHDFGMFAKICYYCGTRRGEVLGLMRSDIDRTTKELQIRRQLEFIGNKGKIKDKLKSRASKRTVPIPDEFYGELCSFADSRPSLYLFADADGAFQTFDAFKWAWKTFVDLFNVKMGGTDEINLIVGFVPHILRHTYATILFEIGVDVKTAQRLLGHDDIMVTMKIYTHLSDKKQAESTDKVRLFSTLCQSNVSQNGSVEQKLALVGDSKNEKTP